MEYIDRAYALWDRVVDSMNASYKLELSDSGNYIVSSGEWGYDFVLFNIHPTVHHNSSFINMTNQSVSIYPEYLQSFYKDIYMKYLGFFFRYLYFIRYNDQYIFDFWMLILSLITFAYFAYVLIVSIECYKHNHMEQKNQEYSKSRLLTHLRSSQISHIQDELVDKLFSVYFEKYIRNDEQIKNIIKQSSKYEISWRVNKKELKEKNNTEFMNSFLSNIKTDSIFYENGLLIEEFNLAMECMKQKLISRISNNGRWINFIPHCQNAQFGKGIVEIIISYMYPMDLDLDSRMENNINSGRKNAESYYILDEHPCKNTTLYIGNNRRIMLPGQNDIQGSGMSPIFNWLYYRGISKSNVELCNHSIRMFFPIITEQDPTASDITSIYDQYMQFYLISRINNLNLNFRDKFSRNCEIRITEKTITLVIDRMNIVIFCDCHTTDQSWCVKLDQSCYMIHTKHFNSLELQSLVNNSILVDPTKDTTIGMTCFVTGKNTLNKSYLSSTTEINNNMTKCTVNENNNGEFAEYIELQLSELQKTKMSYNMLILTIKFIHENLHEFDCFRGKINIVNALNDEIDFCVFNKLLSSFNTSEVDKIIFSELLL